MPDFAITAALPLFPAYNTLRMKVQYVRCTGMACVICPSTTDGAQRRDFPSTCQRISDRGLTRYYRLANRASGCREISGLASEPRILASTLIIWLRLSPINSHQSTPFEVTILISKPTLKAEFPVM